MLKGNGLKWRSNRWSFSSNSKSLKNRRSRLKLSSKNRCSSSNSSNNLMHRGSNLNQRSNRWNFSRNSSSLKNKRSCLMLNSKSWQTRKQGWRRSRLRLSLKEKEHFGSKTSLTKSKKQLLNRLTMRKTQTSGRLKQRRLQLPLKTMTSTLTNALKLSVKTLQELSAV